jgi:RNA polymerase subunit RPABC4/transcription elongation factor Spt4
MNRITRIKGLSDIRRIPRLGKIYLGYKKISAKSGNEYPVEVDYFVCPPEVQEVYGEIIEERACRKCNKVFTGSEKCPSCGSVDVDVWITGLDIVLPCEDLSQVFPQAYRYWKGSAGLYCKGDGEIAYRMTEAEGQRRARVFVERECLGESCPDYQSKNCNHSANLMIGLPKVKLLGVYQIDTRSYHSIVGVNSDLEYLQQALGSISNLVDIRTSQVKTALVLKRKAQETHGSGRKETHYILSVELALSTQELLEMRGYIGQPLLATPVPLVAAPPQRVSAAPPPPETGDVFEMPPPVEENPLDSDQEAVVDAEAGDGDTTTPQQNHQRIDKETQLNDLMQDYFKGKPKNKATFIKTWLEGKENLGDIEDERNIEDAIAQITGLINQSKQQTMGG